MLSTHDRIATGRIAMPGTVQHRLHTELRGDREDPRCIKGEVFLVESSPPWPGPKTKRIVAKVYAPEMLGTVGEAEGHAERSWSYDPGQRAEVIAKANEWCVAAVESLAACRDAFESKWSE